MADGRRGPWMAPSSGGYSGGPRALGADGKTVVIPPAAPAEHRCRAWLPDLDPDDDAERLRKETLAVCGGCQRAWVAVQDYNEFPAGLRWRRVRWWNFRLQGRLEDELRTRAQRPPGPPPKTPASLSPRPTTRELLELDDE